MAGIGSRAKRKRNLPPDDKEQSARFVETARKLGVAASGKDFERAFGKVVPQIKSVVRKTKP